jgi:hypothetical protein
MRNRDYIEYTYKHRIVVRLLAEKYFPDNKELLEQVELHDLDKLFMYLFYDKKVASKLHREQNAHHANEVEKTDLDYKEMVLDWESARYTKPDKPLNAYDTLYAYYPEMEDVILPILQEMGIAEANTAMEEDIVKATLEIGKVTSDDIEKELTKGVKVLLKVKNK